jgi:hypothetical protein
MPADKPKRKAAARKQRLAETIKVLTALQFAPKQRNETAAYTLLALLDLQPDVSWAEAQAPLRGVTPVIGFIAAAYGVRYAPNTRETIRDDAVKFFLEELSNGRQRCCNTSPAAKASSMRLPESVTWPVCQ